MIFHGFWLVSIFFKVVSWFWLASMVIQGGFMVYHGFWLVSMVFHGFWLVSMVFQGGFKGVSWFWLVSMVFQDGCIVFHGFWLVSIVLLVQNTTNCILAQRSSPGLAGRRPALA